MSEQANNPELSALEAGLAGLAPIAPAIDRDYLFYHAGRTAGRQGAGLWPYASGLMTALALGIGWLSFHRTQPLPALEKPETRIVYVPMPSPAHQPPKVEADAGYSYSAPHPESERSIEEKVRDLKLRDQVLLMGVDALPRHPDSALPDKRAPLDPLLGMPATVLDEPGRNIFRGL